MREGGGERTGCILYSKNGGIQESYQAAPIEGKTWGQGDFITTYVSWQALNSAPYSAEYLGHQCNHVKNWCENPYATSKILPDLPPACLARYPSISEPLDFVGPVLVSQLGSAP